ncbi:MAG: tRNA lysidine(34) synthetase TilS [Candidatus Limnocylindria bacterium]
MLPPRILEAVARYARTHALLSPGPMIVAVSGGADSTALLLILAELAGRSGTVLHVAHFDHRARPRAGALDAAFVAGLAARIGAPVRLGRAEEPQVSEDAARRARYAFLRHGAALVGASAVATGHTRDDQAETVLLHLTRGSGIDGLAGMRPSSAGIVRPLLCIGRAETLEVCAAAGIKPREDPSNRALRFARNRVRHRVLPELARINPQVAPAIARLADSAAETVATLRGRAPTLPAQGDDGTIDLGALPIDAGMRSRALAAAYEVRTGRALGARQRAALDGLCAAAAGTAALDLPGGRAVREYTRLSFEVQRQSAGRRAAEPALLRHAVGDVPSPDASPLGAGAPLRWHGWTFLLARAGEDVRDRYTVSAPLDLEWGPTAPRAEIPDQPLVVRQRRPGDRFGRRKLQDVLVDAKIPARRRDTLPLVATGPRVLWIASIGAAPGTGTGQGGWFLWVRSPASGPNSLWPSYVPPVASNQRARLTDKG